MARYFFHLHEGGQRLPDPDGMEIDDLDGLREAALTGARSIVSHDARSGVIDLSGSIEVADTQGRVVLVVSFADAVRIRA
jgi:hypothetical protein